VRRQKIVSIQYDVKLAPSVRGINRRRRVSVAAGVVARRDVERRTIEQRRIKLRPVR
jgi:hypothetical protein